MIDAKDKIPIWRQYALTISEAAGYYRIGETKLREMINNNPHADWMIKNGNRTLIKRARFEQYLDEQYII